MRLSTVKTSELEVVTTSSQSTGTATLGIERARVERFRPSIAELEAQAALEAPFDLRLEGVIGRKVIAVEHVDHAELRIRLEEERAEPAQSLYRRAALQPGGDGRRHARH